MRRVRFVSVIFLISVLWNQVLFGASLKDLKLFNCEVKFKEGGAAINDYSVNIIAADGKTAVMAVTNQIPHNSFNNHWYVDEAGELFLRADRDYPVDNIICK